MIYNISAKNCHLSKLTKENIEKNIINLSKYLSNFTEDLPLFFLLIRWHRKKDYYDGSIILRIPKKPLFATFKGDSIYESVQLGFERIRRELEEYKGLHFPSYSEYFDHTSLRKFNESLFLK